MPIAGYKGSGLAMMFECLSSIMAGNPLLEPVLLSRENQPATERRESQVNSEHRGFAPNHIQNSVVAAIDISMFTDLESYRNHIDILIDSIKALPKADGFSEIFVPGELEERKCVERSRDGIPLPEGTIRSLRVVSEKYGVALPPGL